MSKSIVNKSIVSKSIKKGWGACNRWVVGMAVTAACYLPASAWAVLPNAADVADGASTTSPLATTRDLFSRGITIAATIVAALLVLGATWQIYSAFVKAREKGDWKDLGVTAPIGVGMMAGGVVLAVLANTYGQF